MSLNVIAKSKGCCTPDECRPFQTKPVWIRATSENTHTPIHTHARARTHADRQSDRQTDTNTHTHTHKHTHGACARTHTRTHTHTHKHSHWSSESGTWFGSCVRMFPPVSSQMDVPRANHTQGCEDENGIGLMHLHDQVQCHDNPTRQKTHPEYSVNIHEHTYPQSQTQMYWP